MSPDNRNCALRCLDRIESLEASLLGWGLVDGSFSMEEIEILVSDEIAHQPGCPSAATVIRWLLDRRLLWQVFDPGSEPRYRTRMAEGVRLFSRLRQMFTAEHWDTGAELVADYRLHVANRLFPRRDVSADEVLASLHAAEGITPDDLELAREFFRPAGQSLMLARFQVRATSTVLRALRSNNLGACIVCAGTGSGKTLTFYLPAFLHLGGLPKPTRHCHVIALYPRKELLKDQLRATLESLQDFGEEVRRRRGAPISVGALFDAVPYNGPLIMKDGWHGRWPKTTVTGTPAFGCPFILCPACGHEMAWKVPNIREGREELECPSCGGTLGPDVVRLTRESLEANPPDILFTTTEMMNRQLSHSGLGPLFGVGVGGAPRLVLLDEVHTYGGITGAHVALLLRRWRFLAKGNPYFVGLSATLADASRFMSDLTGVFESSVTAVEPGEEEMEVGGMEYVLALRGDPVGGTSLLSTSIQSAMLLSRLLDADGNPITQGVVGTRLFAFTDNLDVTNRLYNDLRDAEGFGLWGPNNNAEGSLANLRRLDLPQPVARWSTGQLWKVSQDIGHNLNSGTRRSIARTSSQDSGVSRDAPTIVATASLEVGFDDPDAGAILQHKAPLDPAQYLQRKGRAGRDRGMRPWTVVVLSDFGRDRLAYQAYDRLFSPQVPARFLPLRNRYVLRIQAAFSLIDWLSVRATGVRGSAWGILSAPTNWPPDIEAQREFKDILFQALTDPAAQASLGEFLQRSLGITEREVSSVLWEAPRSLLFEVIPTLLRRLSTGWSTVHGKTEPYRRFLPLPEFAPRALFEDLNLPEIGIVLPGREDDAPEWMPYRQGLTEFTPGRVSHRFAVGYRKGRWSPIPLDRDTDKLAVSSFMDDGDFTRLGAFSYDLGGRRVEVPVLRPFRIRVQEPPSHLLASSNAFWLWRTQIVTSTDGRPFHPSARSRWSSVIAQMSFFTHLYGEPVEVRRFAGEFRAETRFRSGAVPDRMFTLVSSEDPAQPVAVGFSIDVDAVRIGIRTPNNWLEVLRSSPELLRAIRVRRFKHLIHESEQLNEIANSFQRDQFSEICLLGILTEALDHEVDLEVAGRSILMDNPTPDFSAAQAAAFQASTARGDGGGDHQKGRYQELSSLLRNKVVVEALRFAAPCLWDPPDESWGAFLDARFLETTGSALLKVFERIGENLTAGDLLVDILRGTDASHHPTGPQECSEVWISEANPGGSGFIETVLHELNRDPQRFFSLLEAELSLTAAETSDQALQAFLTWAAPTSSDSREEVQDAAATIRAQDSHSASRKALARLKHLLSAGGILPDHTSVNAITLRLLRPGTSPESDDLVLALLSVWKEYEVKLGLDIDARLMACYLSRTTNFDGELAQIWPNRGGSPQTWRFGKFSSLLWPRGYAARSGGWEFFNPFTEDPHCDRLLLSTLLPPISRKIDPASPTWRDEVLEELTTCGEADLVAPQEGLASLSNAVLEMAANPMDTGTLLLHPRIGGVERTIEGYRVRVEMPEYFS